MKLNHMVWFDNELVSIRPGPFSLKRHDPPLKRILSQHRQRRSHVELVEKRNKRCTQISVTKSNKTIIDTIETSYIYPILSCCINQKLPKPFLAGYSVLKNESLLLIISSWRQGLRLSWTPRTPPLTFSVRPWIGCSHPWAILVSNVHRFHTTQNSVRVADI